MYKFPLNLTYVQLLEARMFRNRVIHDQKLIQQECDYDLSTATDALTKALNTYIETLNYLMEHN